MNPFTAQHQAFGLAQAGKHTEATALFIDALKGFRKLISDVRLRQFVVTRAGLIPGQEARAEEIAEQFLLELPRWLRELHFDSFYAALTSYDLKRARTHWNLLVASSEQSDLTSVMNLSLLREQVCHRRQVTRDAIKASDNEGQDVLNRAEDILTIDGSNNTARRMAITVYTQRLRVTIEHLTGNKDQKKAVKAISKLNTGKRQRLHDSRRTVRRLRQHLRRAQSRADADVEEMIESYRELSHYYLGVGEVETAIKLTRRARRLLPQDENLRVWARGIRQLRRRG